MKLTDEAIIYLKDSFENHIGYNITFMDKDHYTANYYFPDQKTI